MSRCKVSQRLKKALVGLGLPFWAPVMAMRTCPTWLMPTRPRLQHGHIQSRPARSLQRGVRRSCTSGLQQGCPAEPPCTSRGTLSDTFRPVHMRINPWGYNAVSFLFYCFFFFYNILSIIFTIYQFVTRLDF